MKDNFKACLPIILKYEGGKVNDPRDPGGRTKKGITQHVYDDFRSLRRLPKRTVYEIEDSEVSTIYRDLYWQKVNGDDLPAGLDLAVFDPAVNSGPGRALQWLRAARDKAGTPVGQIDAICDTRLSFLHALKTWSHFGKGWGARVADVRAKAHKMALGVNAAPTLNRKAQESESKANKASTQSGGAVVAGSGGGAVGAAQMDWRIIVAIVVVGLAVAAWFWIRARQNFQQAEAFREAAKEA